MDDTKKMRSDEIQNLLFGQVRNCEYSQLVTLTPSMAAKILALNTGERNRPVSDRVVLKYTRQMNAGDWPLTSGGIGLSFDGAIINGWHRLHALAKAARSIKINVVWGQKPASYDKEDIGKKRTIGDMLAIAYPDLTDRLRVAGTVRVALLGLQYDANHPNVEPNEIVEAVGELRPLVAQVVDALRVHPATATAGVCGAFVNAMRVSDAQRGPKGLRRADLVMECARRIRESEFSGKTDPLGALLARLNKEKARKSSEGALSTGYIYALTTAALRAAIDARPLAGKIMPTTVDWGDKSDTIKNGTAAADRRTVSRVAA